MRILVSGDRFWNCDALAAAVIRRLVDRYGQEIVVVHGGATGVAESFETAAKGMGVATEAHPVTNEDSLATGKRSGPLRNQRMVDAGADLCLAVHRFVFNSKGTKDCARRAIEAGILTYLIDSEKAEPKRLLADDPRLE